MMHEGQLRREQMQAWALNRYYYQSRIPIKDAIILSRSNDPTFAVRGANALSITTAVRSKRAELNAG
jgi:pyrroloquinoline quinone (PQQ) biosynthesis protein C